MSTVKKLKNDSGSMKITKKEFRNYIHELEKLLSKGQFKEAIAITKDLSKKLEDDV